MHPTLRTVIVSLGLATSMLASNAIAQSSSGNIVGEAAAGDTVIVSGVETGFKRELKIEKDGKYQVRGIPTGDYRVVRVHKDGSVGPTQSIRVRVGSTARVIEQPAKSDDQTKAPGA